MRISALAVVLLSLVVVSEARADGVLSLDSVHLNARGHVVLDGDGRDDLGHPVGVDAEIQLDLVSDLDLYGTVGFLYGLSGNVDNWHIPFLAGAVYNFKQGSKSPFVGAAFGAVISNVESLDTEANAALEIAGGYEMSTVRVKAGLMFLDIGEAAETATLFASVGFNLR